MTTIVLYHLIGFAVFVAILVTIIQYICVYIEVHEKLITTKSELVGKLIPLYWVIPFIKDVYNDATKPFRELK